MPETLETRVLLAGDLMHNAALPTDVNADGYTSPLDALDVINRLNGSSSKSSIGSEAARSSGLFYDVNNDQTLSPLDALLVLNKLNGEGEEDDLVQIRLQTSDLEGNPITAIDLGQDFLLQTFVQDLTGREVGGVFAGYVDVQYDAALVSVAGDIEHSTTYGNAVSGNLDTPGLMDEVGSIDGLNPLGPNEFLLFSVQVTASGAGSVSFIPDPADISPAHDVLVYGVPDGEESSVVSDDRIAFVPATLQINADSFPEAVDDNYEVVEDNVLIVGAGEGVLANDINPGPGDLVASLVDGPTDGQLSLAANGSFSYTPDAGFVGQDTFTYTADLAGVSSNAATVTIDVTADNTPPVANDDDYSTTEDTPLVVPAIGVLENDIDGDGNTLTAILVSDPSNGSVVLNDDGGLTYTPDADFNGIDTFEYRANDGLSDSNVATVTVTVDAANDPPIAQDNEYSVALNTTLIVSAEDGVLSNDFDPDGDALTAQLLTGTSNGTLDFSSDGSFSYEPTVDFVGLDTFTYAANDGTALSEPATVTITVTGATRVNFRFEAVNLLGDPITSTGPGSEFTLNTYVQDVSSVGDGVFSAYLDVFYSLDLVGVNGQITYGDSYPNQQSGNTTIPGLIDEAGAFDGLSPLGGDEFLLLSIPMIANAEGTAIFEGDPADDLPAHDVLLFNEGTPVPKDEIDYGMFELTIVAGEAPVAVDDEYDTDEDVTLIVNAENGVLANDIDGDSEILFAILVTDPSNGTVDLQSDGSFTYVPDGNFFGIDTFTYQASDGSQTSNVAIVTITVNPIDDAPIAVDDFYQMNDRESLEVDAENGVLANDLELDGEPLTAVLVSGAGNGTVELFSDGSFVYSPVEGFIGRDTFTYLAIANDVESNVATVSIDVGDLTPSTIVGFVYNDTDNDGIRDDGEARYGGVRITLRGTDLFDREISLETITAGDGSYQFDGILRGQYVLTEFQPLGLVDGKDTIDGELSYRNDRFMIDLPGGVVAGDYNFGERGLTPGFIKDPFFFASTTRHGLLAMMNYSGEMEWYCLDSGWSGLTSVDIGLSANRTVAEVSVRDVFGGTDSSDVRLNTNRNARLLGNHPGGELLRLTDDPSDYGLFPQQGESELEESAVDAAFGGNDA